MANELLSWNDLYRELHAALSKCSPAEQAAFVYSMQSSNGFPRDLKQEAQIKAQFEAEIAARGEVK